MLEYATTLKRQQYAVFGEHRHSAAKLCRWTKKSLRGRGACYKQAFYGVQSHRCLQMTPNVYCNQRCDFCWRTHETMAYAPSAWDKPAALVEEAVRAQRKLLSGFGGDSLVDKQKFREAQEPNQAAISLTGEPTIYPHLAGLIQEFRRRNFTTFLVTNGTLPERLAQLAAQNLLPTQLYVSLDAPTRELHARVDRPLIADAWDRLMRTLELLPGLGTRRVVRITCVKGLNMVRPEVYAALLERARPDFVEVKAFMAVGGSRARGLGLENMPSHDEVADFAEKINERLGYELAGEHKASRVVLLSNGEKQLLIKASAV